MSRGIGARRSRAVRNRMRGEVRQRSAGAHARAVASVRGEAAASDARTGVAGQGKRSEARRATQVGAADCVQKKGPRRRSDAALEDGAYAAQRCTGMPSWVALSTRFSVTPLPGNAITPFGSRFSSSSLRRNGAARP